jgi:copper chaperone NosL
MTRALMAACLVTLTACAGGPTPPAELDTRGDVCASCRMTVSSRPFAGQIVAPGELPLFFDDIGCLVAYLGQHPALDAGAVAYVADHRTGAWVRAGEAVFTRAGAFSTPMGSHLIAHASAESRDADPAARGGAPVRPASLLAAPFPDGAR